MWAVIIRLCLCSTSADPPLPSSDTGGSSGAACRLGLVNKVHVESRRGPAALVSPLNCQRTCDTVELRGRDEDRTERDGRGQDKAGGDASEEEGTRERRADGGECQEQGDKTEEETGEKRAKTQEWERDGQVLYQKRTALNKRLYTKEEERAESNDCFTS